MSLLWLTDQQDALVYWKHFDKIASPDVVHPYAYPDYVWLSAGGGKPGIAYWQSDKLTVWYPLILTPLPESTGLAGVDAVSPYGIGGPLVVGDCAYLPVFWQDWTAFCKQQNILLEFVRFHPLVRNYQDFHAFYQPVSRRSAVWVDLTVEAIWAELHSGKQKELRRAERFGHAISLDLTHWDAFLACYRASMQQKQANSLYYFSDDGFAQLKQFLSAGHGWLMSVLTPENHYLGGVIFLAGGSRVYYHLAAVGEMGRKQQVSNWLVWQSLLKAKQSGYQQAFLGGGLQENDSLQVFKSRFSPHQADYITGVYVHRKIDYDWLKAQHKTTETDRVMFYR